MKHQRVKIPLWCKSWANQECQIGDSYWVIPRLVELSKDLEVFDLPILHINLFGLMPSGMDSMLGFISHIRAVEKADLKYPIILSVDGEVMDGRHRIAKALLQNKSTIKAVRLTYMPGPDRTDKKD
jgi:hypothetical protein